VAEVPLATLLSWAWIAFAIEADNTVEAAGSDRVRRLFRVSMAMWANGLRCIGEEGTTVDDLRAAARAACNIGGLERWGWITVGDPGAGRRDGYGSHRGVTGGTVLRPTRAGSYARRLWPRTVTDVQQRWRTRFGDDAVGSASSGPATCCTRSTPPLPRVVVRQQGLIIARRRLPWPVSPGRVFRVPWDLLGGVDPGAGDVLIGLS
jgi:hypothetical protein